LEGEAVSDHTKLVQAVLDEELSEDVASYALVHAFGFSAVFDERQRQNELGHRALRLLVEVYLAGHVGADDWIRIKAIVAELRGGK
jgi:hypothetical protein